MRRKIQIKNKFMQIITPINQKGRGGKTTLIREMCEYNYLRLNERVFIKRKILI